MAEPKKDTENRKSGRESARTAADQPRREIQSETERRRERAKMLRANNRSRRLKTR